MSATNEFARRRLLDELARLEAESESRESLHVEVHPDQLDQSLSDQERENISERIEHCAFAIRAIRAALEKLQQGAYGVCDECGAMIPPRRLLALPWTEFCLDCQQKHEARFAARGAVRAEEVGERLGA